MFPGLFNEFINADLDYRYTRAHRSFLEQDRRRSARAGRTLFGRRRKASRASATSPTLSPRSV